VRAGDVLMSFDHAGDFLSRRFAGLGGQRGCRFGSLREIFHSAGDTLQRRRCNGRKIALPEHAAAEKRALRSNLGEAVAPVAVFCFRDPCSSV